MKMPTAKIGKAVACLFEQRGACTYGMNLEPCAPVIQGLTSMYQSTIFDDVIGGVKPRSWKSYRHTQYGVM